MSGKVPSDEGTPKTADPAHSDAVPTVDELSGQIMMWIGLSMRLSKSRPMTESLGMLNELGLTMPQLVALHVMAFEGSMTMTRLVERIGLSTSAVSHLLHRLVQMGLCERQDDPGDRRQKRVRLTAEGRDVVGKLMRSRMADTRSSIEPLSDDTRRRLAEVLNIMVNELSEKAAEQAASEPSTSAGWPRPDFQKPRSFEDVLHDVEEFGDDIAESAAAVGDAVAEHAAAVGDRIADRAAALGDAIAAEASAKAAALSDRIVKNVTSRVSRKKNQNQE